MADSVAGAASAQPPLNLTTEEKRVFKQLFSAADTDNLGVVTGEVAVKFFEKTRLEPRILGEIWQIADTENRGLLTPSGFGIVLRLIGHYQSGKDPSPELAYVPGPLPRFDGLSIPGVQPIPPAAALQAQSSGGAIRVPQLPQESILEYHVAFEQSRPRNGLLGGDQAKQVFERFKLPNEILGRVWNLADVEGRGSLNSTEFVVAMHLLSCLRTGALKQLPPTVPPALFEAVARRPTQPPLGGRGIPGGRPGDVPPVPGIPKQFSGSGPPSSPLARSGFGTPPQSSATPGNDWAISPADKAQFDSIFSNIDKNNRGYITGDEAVPFFGNSRLPEEILAQIWDLADINSEGHLNRDEFAVAIHLIRQQRALREDARGNLPSTLPANLVPPSMRHQIRPPQQPTAPVFDNTAYGSSKPSEDLFGLDAFSTSTNSQPPASTVSSSTFNRSVDSDMFGNKKASSSATSTGQTQPSTSIFKPFVPSSSFGQNMISGNTTGDSSNSGPSQSRGAYRQEPSAMEDLLGDNDPEVSSRLTNETTDLANLSNQAGTLTKQLQEVKTKRASTEQDLNQINSQKREFELRLSQLRSHYEQEMKDVKVLDSRLAESRAEVRKLQQDCSGLETTLQDLQVQRVQIVNVLETDQMENADLKERIKSASGEIAQLRTQLEKLRLESRQQKGLVSINKKQLSTSESEREKLRGEANELSRNQETSRSQVQSPGDITSPLPSSASQSTNPFFRRTPTASTDAAIATSPFATSEKALPNAQSQSNQSFDSMFGPSYGNQQTSQSTGFRSNDQSGQTPVGSAPSGQSVRSSEGPDVPTPVSSPPNSSYHESPRSAEPPPPPESRQITSSFLPLRSEIQRNDSFSSSVKVAAPASSTTTETERDVSRSEGKKGEKSRLGSGSVERGSASSPAVPETKHSLSKDRDAFPGFGSSAAPKESIPGAFPGEPTSPIQTNPTGESNLSDRSKGSSRPSESFSASRNDPFAASREANRLPSGSREDFDAAFAGFSSSKGSQERQHSATSADGSVGASSTGASRFNQEFPPIKENYDGDSDSTSGHGFDDDFTTSSPHQKHDSVSRAAGSGSRPGTGVHSESNDTFGQRPAFTSIGSASSQGPSSTAQKSTSPFDHVSTDQQGSSRDAGQFGSEFGGLLPSRQETAGSSSGADKSFGTTPSGGQTLFGGSTASKGPSSSAPTAFSNSPPLSNTPLSTAPSDAYQSAVSHPSAGKGPSPPIAHSSRAHQAGSFDDDFDREFADLSEAKEADDKGDDDFGISSHHRDGADEFNPVFDSPAVSKSSTIASDRTATGTAGHGEDHFNDFEHNIGGPTHASSHPKGAGQQQQQQQSHDWDAIFSNIDSNQASSSTAPVAPLGKGISSGLSPTTAGSSSRGIGEAVSSSSTTKAPLSRTISTGTENDEPNLKQLISMGYSRDKALDALEKYDYHVDKAADYLVRNVSS